MGELFAALGIKVLADLVSKMVMGGLRWAKDRERPEPGIIELKLGKIAARALPDSIPEAKREAVIVSLVELAMPTFEQIVEYNPTTQKIIMSAVKKSAGGYWRSGPAKNAVAKKVVAKKAPAKKVVAKKSPAKKVAAKKAPAKKAPAKKAAAKRSVGRR